MVEETAFPKPRWADEIARRFSAGIAHAFVLHFDVHDYAVPGVPLTTYLARMLSNREVVAIYSRDRGITFPVATMEERFRGMVGGEAVQDPALSALAALGGQTAGEAPFPRSPQQAVPLLDALLRVPPIADEGGQERGQTAVIVEFAEAIVPAADIATLSPADRDVLAAVSRWGRDAQIAGAGNPVFLLASHVSGLHPAIRAASARFEALQVPLPGPEERLAFIHWYLAQREDPPFGWTNLTPEALTNATAGLSLLHVEDILLRAEAEGELRSEMVRERKEAIIRSEYGDVLEVMEPRFGFDDVGGLAHVKEFFTRSVIRPMREGRTRRCPMGVLMTGPAGCGKSIVAEGVAREAGINAVRLRIGGQIASKWQGEGERNLERALTAIEGMVPTIVLIDEIDQAVSRGDGSGGSQQDRRIFQRLLEWMSDTGHRGKVILLAACNRPDLMDAALRRPGRFDKKTPFLVPDEEERRAIFTVMCRRYGLQGKDDPAGRLHIPDECVTATDGWTGAEIEVATIKAVELVEDEGLEPGKALVRAVQRIRPSTADIEYMTLLALKEVGDYDLLPPKYQAIAQDREKIEKRVEELQVRMRGRREL